MKELEVKIVNIDPEEIRARMKAIGAVLVKKENQVNKIFDFEDKRLLDKKGYARIRIVDDLLKNRKHCYMTTKKLISQDRFKVMEENEIEISDSAEGENIFRALGLVQYSSIARYRESYRFKSSLIEIDINDRAFFPVPYVEIETGSERELEEIVGLLGYGMEDATSKTIFQLLEEFKAEGGGKACSDM
ncbi:MAG: cyaB [Firmicutes bacterium]|nr:cyaB [Bacillota bacterium]